jgi:ADP-ribosylglycohydrolase
MNATPATGAPLPLRNCYWVLTDQLLAGEHPGGHTREETRTRLSRLLQAGVECFIDLTQPGEVERYDEELPPGVEYLRKPVKDHGLPDVREHMEEILDCLHDALRTGRRIYVHCRAGIGRTGMVVGCLLVERGMGGDEALDELNRLWRQSERAATWSWVPETEEQNEYVRTWKRRTPARGAAAVQHADPLLEASTLEAAKGLRSRFLGALVGLAVGDALAAATQYRRPGSFTPVGDLLGGGPFDLPRGGWSDDTAMSLCIADSLLECGRFDARDQVERLRRWQRDGYLSATGECLGITASTARALAMAQWRRQAFSGSHDPQQLDPEPLSRVPGVTLFFFASAAEAAQQAAESARTTCQAPTVLEACRKFAGILHGALSGRSKEALLAEAPSAARTDPAGSAREVLAAAIESFRSTGSFRDAVLRAVNLGGCSDVTAAVCGSLAGAHYTVAAIPPAWRNALIQKELVENFADRLLAHALVGLSG